MSSRSEPAAPSQETDAAGPRAILRVPEVLMAIAGTPDGRSLAELGPLLGVPKTSLHRLLRTLERGGYLTHAAGLYRLGPTSFRLATMIGRAAPSSSFPACARPVLERLAQESEETVMLGVVSGPEPEILYVDVIDSEAPIRFTLTVGDRRPLYCAASGMAVLAFFAPDARRRYVDETEFSAFTPRTIGPDAMPEELQKIAATAVAFDNGGKVLGAAGIASPVFDRHGEAIASISIAGPSERVLTNRSRFEELTRAAGIEVSRLIGYEGPYPPPPAPTTAADKPDFRR